MNLRSTFLAIALFAASPVAAAIPERTDWVTDAAHVIPIDDQARLTSRVIAIEKATHHSIVVVTVPSLDGLDIEEYGIKLARTWKIGRAKANDGVILLLAPTERKVRIEIGTGLEGDLTDADSKIILHNEVSPLLKQRRYGDALMAGVNGIASKITPVAEPLAATSAPRAAPESHVGLTLVFILIPIFIIVGTLVVMSTARRNRKRRADELAAQNRAAQARASQPVYRGVYPNATLIGPSAYAPSAYTPSERTTYVPTPVFIPSESPSRVSSNDDDDDSSRRSSSSSSSSDDGPSSSPDPEPDTGGTNSGGGASDDY